jgi:hypothetical protein
MNADEKRNPETKNVFLRVLCVLRVESFVFLLLSAFIAFICGFKKQ